MRKARRRKDRQMSAEPGYLRRRGVAHYLQVGTRTVDRLQQLRILPFRRVRGVLLFRRDEIDRALDGFKVQALGESEDPVSTAHNTALRQGKRSAELGDMKRELPRKPSSDAGVPGHADHIDHDSTSEGSKRD